MAIAFDAGSGTTGGSSTSTTLAHTCTGSNLVLFGGLFVVGTGTPTCTYNGVSMTRLQNVVSKPGAPEEEHLFGLLAPATGANNLVATYTTASAPSLQAVSFTGVKQTGLPDASSNQSTSGTTVTASVTTVGDNAWGVLFVRNDAGAHMTAGTNSTIAEDTGNGTFFYSTTPKTPAGTLSMVANCASSSSIGALMASFIAAPPASGPANLKSLDTNLKANIKSYNSNLIANIKSINSNV